LWGHWLKWFWTLHRWFDRNIN